MNKEKLLEEIVELPKIETNNPIITMNSITVDDLMSVIDRLNKVPDYNDLLKENQELREALEIKSYCKYANKCNEIYDCSREEYEDMANANMRLNVENQTLKKQLKLFDTKPLIDKNVITQNDKKKWQKAFQKYCDSEEIRKESENTGLNACGYYYACDLCDGADLPCACARATIQYLKEKGIIIDYRNTSKEYLDKILRYED